jgi:isoleucyl-tRNA synthetase
VAEAYRKLRGTLRFLLGNLADFDPVEHTVPFDQLPAVDRWLLARHAVVMAEVAEAYDSYQVCVLHTCWFATLMLAKASEAHVRVEVGCMCSK